MNTMTHRSQRQQKLKHRRHIAQAIWQLVPRGILLVLAFGLVACDDGLPPSSSLEVANKGINGGSISHDGEYAVVGSIFHGGSLWRLSDGERLYNWNHTQDEDDRIILSADINAYNTYALTADAASMVLWDMKTGEAHRFWRSPAEILDTSLSLTGEYVLLGLADHSAVLFDAIRGGVARTFSHQGRVRSVDLSSDQQLAITGSEDHSAIIWDVRSSKPLMTIKHDEDVQFVKFSPDARYAITSAQFDRVEIWDVQQQQSLAQLPLAKTQLQRGLRVTAARFSNDASQILLGYPNRKVELRETKTLKLLKEWSLPKRTRWQPTAAAVINLAFDKTSEQYKAMSSDGFIHQLE